MAEISRMRPFLPPAVGFLPIISAFIFGFLSRFFLVVERFFAFVENFGFRPFSILVENSEGCFFLFLGL